MAVNYQIPPWIKAPDLVGDYQRGLVLGQQAAQESQRLQMQQEENQRQHLMDQQRLQVEKSFKDQQLSMQKQELDQATQLNALKTQEAAQAVDARNKYEQFVQAGGDPSEGLLRFGPRMDQRSLAGYATFVREYSAQKHPFVPSEMTTTGGTRMVQLSPGRYQVIQPPKSVQSDLEKFDVSDLKSQLKVAEKDLEKVNVDEPTVGRIPMIEGLVRRRNRVADLKNEIRQKLVNKDELRRLAHHAIAARAPEDKVRARYKQLTGEDLDAETANETTDEEE